MAGPHKSLVIVEDDQGFARTLSRAFERRGYRVTVASKADQLRRLIQSDLPDFAVVDLKLGASSGLPCVRALHASNRRMRIVVVTGYPSIVTAVEAIKLGAIHYLPKPVNADEIEAAFTRTHGDPTIPLSSHPTPFESWEWEHISGALAATGFNISEAARRLDMHRRTLARKLKRRSPH